MMLVGWVVATSVAGCATGRSASSPSEGSTNAVSTIRPLDGSVGRVLQVQAGLRFVVVDYSLNQPPPPGQRLVCYREAEPVAILKAGFIRRETTISADVISGTPVAGDEVRVQEPEPDAR
jgi:hypothetical protein